MNLIIEILLQARAAGSACGGSMMWIMLVAMIDIMISMIISAIDQSKKDIASGRK